MNDTLPQGFYGLLGNSSQDTDLQLANMGLNLPQARNSFKGVQYNQNEIQANSCSIHGALGVLTDLTGYTFTLAERQEMYRRALRWGIDHPGQDTYNPAMGWWGNLAVKLVADFWNEKHPDDEVSYYSMDFASPTFMNVMKKGYSATIGYSGNGTYNLDFINDDKLDGVTFGNSTYGHFIRMHMKDADNMQDVDNYGVNGYGGKNTYLVPATHLRTLRTNGVYYPTSYTYVPKKEYFSNQVMNNISPWAVSSVEKAKAKGLDISNPQAQITPEQLAQMFFTLKIWSSTGIATQERVAVALDRMGALDAPL